MSGVAFLAALMLTGSFEAAEKVVSEAIAYSDAASVWTSCLLRRRSARFKSAIECAAAGGDTFQSASGAAAVVFAFFAGSQMFRLANTDGHLPRK